MKIFLLIFFIATVYIGIFSLIKAAGDADKRIEKMMKNR